MIDIALTREFTIVGGAKELWSPVRLATSKED
jgi:hypothetical protein